MLNPDTQTHPAPVSTAPPSGRSSERLPARPLNVLCFATKECWPPNTGARLRHYYLARELARHARVTYLCFAEDGAARREERADSAAACRGSFPAEARLSQSVIPPLTATATPCERVIAVPREQRYTLAKIVRGAVGRTPLPMLNYQAPVMARELTRLLDEQDFDVVQIENIQLISYVPMIRASRRRPLLILDWHNIESEVMERYGQHAPSLPRRLYAQRTARQLTALEVDALSLFDAHLTVSDRDRVRLLEWVPGANIRTIENGVDIAYYSNAELDHPHQEWSDQTGSLNGDNRDRSPRRNRVLFVGSMDYHANVDAVVSFARECWPEVFRQRPDLIFTIVGRNPAPEVRALAQLPGIEVTGTVDDVRPYYRQAAAEVVPLRIGGGSRLKILEAMAAGVPVISTRLGAEGLDVRDDENILLTDTVGEIGRPLLELLTDERKLFRLSTEGRNLVRKQYDWQAIGEALRRTYHEQLHPQSRLETASAANSLALAANETRV